MSSLATNDVLLTQLSRELAANINSCMTIFVYITVRHTCVREIADVREDLQNGKYTCVDLTLTGELKDLLDTASVSRD